MLSPPRLLVCPTLLYALSSRCPCLFLSSLPESKIGLACLRVLVCPSISAKDMSMVRNRWVSTSSSCVPSDLMLSYLVLLANSITLAFPLGDSKLLSLPTLLLTPSQAAVYSLVYSEPAPLCVCAEEALRLLYVCACKQTAQWHSKDCNDDAAKMN